MGFVLSLSGMCGSGFSFLIRVFDVGGYVERFYFVSCFLFRVFGWEE